MTADAFTPVHLSRHGVSVVVAPDDDGVPVLVHWGATLGDPGTDALAALVAARRPGVPHSAYDRPRATGLVPEVTRGFTGTPALEGHRTGGDAAALPRLSQWSCEPDEDGPDTGVRLTGVDDEAGWAVEVRLLLSEAGLLRARTSVTNTRDGVLHLSGVRTALTVGAHASELLDLTGRWCKERAPQRHPWVQGTHRRDVTTRRTPSAPPRATACSAAASCWLPARWPSSRVRPTTHRGCWGRGRARGSTR